MEPLVSVLIPAHNAEGSIADTIRSALAQSWVRKEIVVVDDGSTDATLQVARQFASDRVRVIHQDNAGAAAARNTALSASQGDYLQWLDADDLLSVDKIRSQVQLYAATAGPRTLASCGWGCFFHRPWKAKFVPSPLWMDLDPREWLLRKWETNSHMQTATWLVPRQLTDETGCWDARLLSDDDGEYFTRVVARSDGVRFTPGERVYYRVSPSSRVSYIGMSHAKLDAQFLAMELQIREVRALCDDARTRGACTSYLQTWMWHFYPNRPDIVERATALAATWGGELRMPTFSWKYGWIRRSFGWSAAKRVQLRYNEAKSSVTRACDHALMKARGGMVDVRSL